MGVYSCVKAPAGWSASLLETEQKWLLWEEFDEAATCHNYRTGCSRNKKKTLVVTCGLVSITQKEEISKILSRTEDLYWKWLSKIN